MAQIKYKIINYLEKLFDFYNAHKNTSEYVEIAVGSDSQNKLDTKMVTVIVIYAEGKGGITFSYSEHLPLIESIREKVDIETGRSLLTATTLIGILESDRRYEELYLNCPISIHVDVGNSVNGKTRDLVNHVIGWVKATGFDCAIKPDSYASSSVADKISK